MPLFNIFKNKEEEKKSSIVKKEEKAPKEAVLKQTKKGSASQILHSPHVTEKSSVLSEKNKYVFKVFPKSNKIEIKKAVSSAYGVDVIDVKIINVSRKKRRIGRNTGWKKGYKKAIIKLKEGQKIEILPR